LANSSAKILKSDPELANCGAQYQFLMEHLTRKTYQIEVYVFCFLRCSKPTFQGKKFFNFLKQNDGMVPTDGGEHSPQLTLHFAFAACKKAPCS